MAEQQSTNPTAVDQNPPKFDTAEILWYKNGIWGEAGYAIPNPMHKTMTSNEDIYELHSLLGRTMFELLHRREAVGFVAPPHKQFWFDLHQMVVIGRKRLNDLTRADNDSAGLVVQHAQPVPRMFVVYPVPYFGDRIRQPDIRKYATIAMLALSEIMQHSDNERIGYVTARFTATIGLFLQEILAQMAMKYFGKDRTTAYKPDFALADADFAAYDPSKVMINVEMSEERPPEQWWPTTNDLSMIKALPVAKALLLAERWPTGSTLYSGDMTQWPGSGSAGQDANKGTLTGANTSGTFVAAPNAAP